MVTMGEAKVSVAVALLLISGFGLVVGQDCGQPPPIANALPPEATTTAVNGVALYTCIQGFTTILQGAESQVGISFCQDNGQWSAAPVCTPQATTTGCGDPGEVTGATRTVVTDFNENGIVVYACNAGLQGGGNIVCRNGQWSPLPLPTCTGGGGGGGTGDCGDPPTVPNAQRIDLTDGVATYQCNPGFQVMVFGFPSESDFMVCLEDIGIWSDIPVCTDGFGCLDPGHVDNGVRTRVTSANVGGIVTYTCLPGYTMQGNSQRTCLSNRQWSPAPTCTMGGGGGGDGTCPVPDTVPNSVVTAVTSFEVGGQATYECFPGYSLQGSDTIRCLTGGIWSHTPSCQQIDCGDPGEIPGAARLSVTDTGVGGIASYVCEGNLVVMGTNDDFFDIECQDNGQWEDRPSCRAPPPTDCPDPGQVPNALRFGQGPWNIGVSVSFSCNFGFFMQGEAILTCMANGQWSAPNPTCLSIQPVDGCPDPEQVPNAFRIGQGPWNVGDTVSFLCNTGFVIQGPPLRTCQANGQWSGPTPTCVPTTQQGCPDPGQVPNAERVGEAPWNVGSFVWFRCNPGFLPQGEPIRECMGNGQWSGTNPVCSPTGRSCPDPGDVENAVRALNSLDIGGTVMYTCVDGYSMEGIATRTCQPSLQWSGFPPRCIRDTTEAMCPDPGQIAFATRSFRTSFYIFSVVHYNCDPCFQGGGAITCLPGGQWAPRMPVCTPGPCPEPGCPDPGNVLNSQRTVTGLNTGGRVTYRCNPGYTLRGTGTLTCQSNGQWTAPPPSCVFGTTPIGCPTPQIPGAQMLSNTGGIATFRCNADFRTITIVCQSNGMWTQGSCEIMGTGCGDPPFVANAQRVQIMEGVISYHCDPGYTIDDDITVRIIRCMANNQWEQRPVCSPIGASGCGEPSNVPNAQRSVPTSTGTGGTVTYTCFPGYTLMGANTRICQSNGIWTPAPTCTRTGGTGQCPDPGPAPNVARVVVSSFLPGGVATYTCEDGYQTTLTGQPSQFGLRTCQDNGMWTPAPVCVRSVQPGNCGVPSAVPNAQVSISGGVATYQCNFGYRMIGSNTRICQANGFWTPGPICTLGPGPVGRSCQDPGQVENAVRRGNSFNDGDTVEYECNDGYWIFGPEEITCDDGQWDDFLPDCEEIECLNPGNIDNGRSNSNAFLFAVGATVTYTCDDGFHLQGEATITCDDDGDWFPFPPTCGAGTEPSLACGFPNPVQNAHITGVTASADGSSMTVTYDCEPGFTMSGAATRVCNNGQWTAPPTCTENE